MIVYVRQPTYTRTTGLFYAATTYGYISAAVQRMTSARTAQPRRCRTSTRGRFLCSVLHIVFFYDYFFCYHFIFLSCWPVVGTGVATHTNNLLNTLISSCRHVCFYGGGVFFPRLAALPCLHGRSSVRLSHLQKIFIRDYATNSGQPTSNS